MLACGAPNPHPAAAPATPVPSPPVAVAPATTPSAAAELPQNSRVLVDLKSLADLQQRFDADTGVARLILLVSPT